MSFPYLFSPITINGLELRNRIVMTAMHLGYTPEGEVSEKLIRFYSRRASGGVGLIIVGGCPIDEHGGMSNMIAIHEDRFIPGLQRLTEAVKSRGAKIAAQLYQAGRYTHSSMIGGRKPFSASAVRSRLTGETPRALELGEIPAIQDRFAEAGLRARRAGFDAVEVLGSAGYLISQFLSPLTNHRQDAYGGSLENRMRFGIEGVLKVRQAVGRDYPIIMRLAGNDFMEGGNTNQEARVFAKELERAGVDLFDVTGGWHETRVPQLTMFVPRRGFVYLAQGIKSAVSVPVLASNRINDPETAEEILRHGEADLVTMARALIADPDLPTKAQGGKPHLIYHCVACNQGCFDSIFRFQPAGCLVNPLAGHEDAWEVKKAPSAKKVLVIGGGAAGLKAACTAAERGHRVTLMEKTSDLGGQLLLNKSIPGRGEMVSAVTDLVHNLHALKVEVVLGREVDHQFVRDAGMDVILLATGAQPIRPTISGIEGKNVSYAWDLLAGKVGVGKRVVIVGGNAVGLETALFLAHQGTLSPEVLHFLMTHRAESVEALFHLLDHGNKRVTVVEMDQRAGQDIGTSTRWTLMAELHRLGVTLMTGAKAIEITLQGLTVEKAGDTQLIPADSVVIAAGSMPVNALHEEIKNWVPEVYVIGDAKEPRNALEAIRAGFLTAVKI